MEQVLSTSKHVKTAGQARKRIAFAGAFLAVVAVASAASMNAYAAEEWYNESELLTSCTRDVPGLGKADSCVFEPDSIRTFTSPDVQSVSETLLNCTPNKAIQKLTWSQTTTATDSIEVSAEVSAGLEGIFNAGLTAKYGYTFSNAVTDGAEETLEVPAGHKGWWARAAALQEAHGRMKINYPKRRYGHFEWYAYPTITSAVRDNSMTKLIANAVPMTEEDKKLCGAGSSEVVVSSVPAQNISADVVQKVVQEPGNPVSEGTPSTGPQAAAD